MTQEAKDDDVMMGGHEETAEFGGSDAEGEGVDIDKAIASVVAERDELRDLLLRQKAEFENFRKRSERERSEFVQFALADCMKEILDVLDSFELALRDIASEEGESQGIHQGYELIFKQLLESLQRFGLEVIDANGVAFDPHMHQGVSTVPTEDVPEGQVLQELRKGYLLKGKLLRPTMVIVAARPESTNDGGKS